MILVYVLYKLLEAPKIERRRSLRSETNAIFFYKFLRSKWLFFLSETLHFWYCQSLRTKQIFNCRMFSPISAKNAKDNKNKMIRI